MTTKDKDAPTPEELAAYDPKGPVMESPYVGDDVFGEAPVQEVLDDE